MAILCRKLGILYGSNAENTCLPRHVLISIIDNDVMEVDDIVSKHASFVKGLLSSRTMRNGYPTLDKMFRVMKLHNRICLRIIDRIEQDEFVLLDRYYSNIKKKTIYLVHIPWHFFLAKPTGF